MIGYKVVRCMNGLFYSVIQWHHYKVGHWTERLEGWGPLALFDTLENAEVFKANLESWGDLSLHIFKCEYSPSQEFDLWQLDCRGCVTTIRSNYLLPTGTILADSILLLEKSL